MSPFSVRRGVAASSARRSRGPLLRAEHILIALIGLIALPRIAAAQQTGVIEGRVVERDTGAPLGGASVAVAGRSDVAITSADGTFRIGNLTPGDHQLTAARLGLRPAEVTVSVSAGEAARVEITLVAEAVLMPEIVVSTTGEARRLGETAATVGVISSQELANARPTHPSEVMQRVPGVWVGVTAGEGHTTAIRMPKSTEPVYLFLEDGVPTRSTGFFNHNALYEVNIPQAGRIEVLKGPATALYGSDAIGGVIDVETRAPTRESSASAYVEGGHNNWNRALISASGTRGNDGVRLDLNLTRTDGWRESTGFDRGSATLRWDHALANGGRIKTLLSASRIDQQTAGSSALLRDDYLADRTINYTPISLRNVRALRFSSALETSLGTTSLSVTPYLRWNEMELLPNWSLTYDPTIYTTGHSSAGLLARASRDFEPLRARVIAGADLDYSPGGREEFAIAPVREGRIFTDYTRGDALYDYQVTFRSLSPYVQVEADPTERLHLTAGLRYDRMAYDYASALEPLETGRWRRPADAKVDYSHLSPKLGAIYEFGRGLATYANYVHGFRAPSEGQLFRQGTAINTIGLEPVVANSYEVGARGERFGRFGYSLAAYRMVVGNDILTYIRPDGVRETQNAGETLHQGVEAGIGVAITPALRADLSYSRAEHRYEEWSPTAEVDYRGNEQEAAPNTLASARLSWSPSLLGSGRIAGEWSRVGSYWMDAENTHRYPGHSLYGVSANLPVGRHLEVIGKVVNLTDERFAESAVYTLARGEEYAPGLPRTVYLGLQYRWGGEAR